MRILMFGWEFPPSISGGLGTACFGITSALAKAGQEIIFVVPRIRGERKDGPVKLLSASDVPLTRQGAMPAETEPKVKWKDIDSPLRPYMDEAQYRAYLARRYADRGVAPPWPELSGDYGPHLQAEVRRYGEAAAIIAGRERFDLIHGHDWTSVPACVRAKQISGRPYIYHAHSLEFDRSGENINRDVYAMERQGMEQADHVIAVSHYTKEIIVKRYGIAPERITVIHNAVSRDECAIRARSEKREGEKIVLFLGRITFQKGPDYFVEAAADVLKVIPEARFVMAGTGDMMPRMVEKVAGLKIGKNFRFTGFLRGPEVERMFAMSDLYVMPSVSEPFGISPLEAMLYDVPVIISRQSGVSEILRHALKVDFWNVQELAGKMIALLKHPALVREMTRQARAELKNIRWEYAAGKILDLYRQFLPNPD